MPTYAGRSKERALTTAIAAGLMGLPAPAVDAPPGPTGPPEVRGFARALDRATAPPSEASPTQEAPPPGQAVAAPAGDAGHEAGMAASTQRSPQSASDADVAEEEPPTSTPDRPAGAVEGEPDAVMLDGSALEAMMAAVLLRPAPESPEAEVASASPVALIQPRAGDAPVAAVPPGLRSAEAVPLSSEVAAELPAEVASPPAAPSGVPGSVVPDLQARPAMPRRNSAVSMAAAVAGAPAVADAIERNDGADSVATPVPTSEPAAALVPAILQAAGRIAPTRGQAIGGSRDVIPTFDGDVAAVSIEVPDNSTASTTATPARVTTPVTPAVARDETVPSPLGLLEGISGDGAASVSASATSADVRTLGRGDAEAPNVEGIDGTSARSVLVPGPTSGTDLTGTASVAATKVSGHQSLPLAAQVAETVHAAVLRGDHEVRLLLNPGDLGRIDVRITEQGGVLRLSLDASQGPTRDLLAREMPALRQALEARDLRVERIQVSHSGSASADGSSAAWQQGSSGQWQQRERDSSPAWSPVANLEQSGGGQQEARRVPRIIRHHGTLDRVA